ncbi:MAG: LCP family protein [Clostridia bacterium]|nr:LCP family protein [Clostridia bacterium]
MYYEPDRPRRRKPARARRRKGCLPFFLRLLIVAVLIVAAISYINGVSLDRLLRRDRLDALSANPALPANRTNILLLGVDRANSAGSRSDSMIVVSVGIGGDVRMVSLMRDTQVSIPGHGQGKLNAAYHYGGADLALRTVNEAFALNAIRYVTIDFAGFADLIDAIGGIELTVSQAERDAMNANAREKYKLRSYGANTHLTGAQALRYARLRKLDSDYRRTARQRQVLNAVLVKMRTCLNPLTWVSFLRSFRSVTKTNLTDAEIASLGLRVLLNGSAKHGRLPAEGTYESGTFSGVWMIRPDLAANRELARQYLYGG